MLNQEQIRQKFHYKYTNLIYGIPSLQLFMRDLISTGRVYIVGGFFRDILHDRLPRDIDVIASHDDDILQSIIQRNKIQYSINRHGGFKLHLENIDVDIWTFRNNWAFKNELVKLYEEDQLNSIAKGCFYNYDSLVICLNNFNFNIRYYNSYLRTNTLDILQKSAQYKILNPTIEANILRAFYLRKLQNIEYSQNVFNYLVSRIGHLSDQYEDPVLRLIKIKMNYPKYDKNLSNLDVKNYVIEIIKKSPFDNFFF